MLQQRRKGAWKDLYTFDLGPVLRSDLELGNYFTSTKPGGRFTSNRIAVLRHTEGETRLVNYRCTTSRRGQIEEENLPDSDVYLEELKVRFGIHLDAVYDQLRPVDLGA